MTTERGEAPDLDVLLGDVDRLAAMNSDLVLRLAARAQQLAMVGPRLRALADEVDAQARRSSREVATSHEAQLANLLREGVAAIMADGVRLDSAAWLWHKRVSETLGDG